MHALLRLVRRLRHLFRRQRIEADMAEEMRFHLEQRAAEFAGDGLSAEDARYAAQRKFGNLGSLQEQARDVRGWGWLERAFKDFRLAVRQLAKSPGFTLLAVVTLGLGIGANTSMFSVLYGIVLKPLPYADLPQLDRFYRVTAQTREGGFSAADYFEFQRAQDGYGEVAAYAAANASLSEPGQPAEFIYAARATANLFPLLGVQPQFGRNFRAEETTPGRDRVVILSQRTWLNRFGARPDVIGRTIRIDGEPHSVVGVMPAAFNDWRYLGDVDVFRPLALSPEQAADRRTTLLRVIGRHSPAHALPDAAAFVANFGRRLAAGFPEVNAGSSWRIVSLQATAVGEDARIMVILVGLSGFVLLIACLNLANLLLARTITRAREFAVRAALGASRLQLLRPLIAESLLLALAGGAVALIVALWFRDWAALRSTGDNGEQVRFILDWRVAAWAFGAALVTAVAFGIAPALFALRLDLNEVLKSGGRGATAGRGHQRFRQVLIVGQFALAMVLLAGAGFFIRALHDLNHRRGGWQSDHLVTGTILLPVAKYPNAAAITAFHRLVLQRLAALPGTGSVSLSSSAAFFVWPETRKLVVDDRERPQPGREPAARFNRVSPGYFETVGTRVLAGRGFDERDTAGSARVFILSQTTAHSLFGRANPIGRRLAEADGESPRWGEVVGVAEDVQSINSEANPVVFQIYQPMAQEPARQIELAIRATGVAPAVLVDAVRATIADLDQDLPVRKLLTADARIERASYQLGVLRDVLTAIAVLGLGLAALGIYGVIARTMAQRTSEFAIRLALGARISDLTRIVLGAGVKLALGGAALGLVGAWAVSRLLAGAFSGMQMNDPRVVVGAAGVLVTVALLACWFPARRASKVDPMTVLRAE